MLELPARPVAAVVFDCDGTLVDTERLSDAALRVVLDRHGYAVTDEDFAAIVGRPWAWTWQRFREQAGLTDEHAFRLEYREEFAARFSDEAAYFPDAEETVRELAAAGVPLAVCTSSTRRHLERVLDLGLRDAFRATVAFEDTDQHKPGPAPYVEAASRLGVDADDCGAVEDTAVGVMAAKAAGMWTVGVARAHDAASLADADVVVRELSTGLFGDRGHHRSARIAHDVGS